jgi:hypothetical protein
MGMGHVARRQPNEFSCECGERISVDPMTKERRIPCPRCGKPVDFTVNFDTTRHTILVSPVVRSAPPPSPGDRAAAEARKPAGRAGRGVNARCSCGTSFAIDEQGLDEVKSCPGCDVSYHIVVKTEAGGKRVAYLVPQKPMVRRDEILRATIVRKKPGSEGEPDNPTAAPEAVVSRRSHTRVIVPKSAAKPVPPVRRKPAPEVPPGAQAVPCPCGQTFIVRKTDLVQGLTCDSCGLVATFQETRDPQTLAPVLRIRTTPRP